MDAGVENQGRGKTKAEGSGLGGGVFITFEGDDGVGKSTHISFLADVLRTHGLEVLCLREPGGTAIGEALRAIVLDAENDEMAPETELLIYEAARAQITAEVIRPALSRGAVVLCDRFADSTMAYQGYGRGLDQDFITAANGFATQGVTPDRTLIVAIPSASRDKRMKKRAAEGKAADRLEAAGEGFHARVSDAFVHIAEGCPERVRIIDASGKHSETAQAIFAQLGDLFPWLLQDSPTMRERLAAFDAAHDHAKAPDASSPAPAVSAAVPEASGHKGGSHV